MDDAEFRNLAVAELDAVYRLACHLSRAAEEAGDFVQETYLRAFRSAYSYVPSENGMRPWLFKILHNVICSRRTSAQRQQSAVSAIHHELLGGLSNSPSTVHLGHKLGAIDWESVDDRLKSAIADLPLENRVAFLLAATEGLKYREIAEVTNVPLGTVMSRLFRAREMLAARLADLAMEMRLTTRAPQADESKTS